MGFHGIGRVSLGFGLGLGRIRGKWPYRLRPSSSQRGALLPDRKRQAVGSLSYANCINYWVNNNLEIGHMENAGDGQVEGKVLPTRIEENISVICALGVFSLD